MRFFDTNRTRGRGGVAAVLAFIGFAASAQATHWPQVGANEGRSGLQPADQATLPMKSRWRNANAPRTSPIVSAGATLDEQRVVWGFERVDNSTNVNGYLKSVRFSDGANVWETDIDDEVPVDGTHPSPPTGDPDQFGPQGGVSPIEASSHTSGPTQTYIVHNDDNQPKTVRDDSAPSGYSTTPNTMGNDIALAQVDTTSGLRIQDTYLGAASQASSSFNTNGYTIESTPVMGPDDGVSGRGLFFTIRNGADKRVCGVTIPSPASSTVNAPGQLICSGNLPDLNTQANPSLMRLRDPASGSSVLMVVLPTTDGVRTVRAGNLGAAGPSISGLGTTWTASLPVQSNGNPPSTTPHFYVASTAGNETVVRKLEQDETDVFDPTRLATFVLAEGDGESPELSGTPGPSLAVAQQIPLTGPGAGTPQPGRVVVTTSTNVYSLDTENLAASNPPQLFSQDLPKGFSRTAPATSGNLGFAATDGGQQHVFFVTPGADGSMRVPLDETGFQRHDQAINATSSLGQPAISRGRVVFTGDAGAFAYGAAVTITSPQAGATVQDTVQVSAYVYDPQLTSVTFKVDGQTFAAGVAVTNNVATATLDTRNLLEGPHALTAEATNGVTAESSSSRIVIVNNWRDPTAQLTASPNPGNVGQPVTLDASGSTPTTGENETITRWAFEVDGDNDYDDVVETAGAGGDGIVQHTFTSGGAKTVAVRVTDSHGDVAQRDASLRINHPPGAWLAATPNPAAAGQTVELDASGSSDSDGTIARYEFDLDGDGSYETDRGTNPRASKAFAQTTEVGVRVTDDEGGHGVARTTVTVGGAGSNQAPTASFVYTPNPGAPGQPIAFNATASRDPDGRIVRYEWDFDANDSFEVSATEARLVHTYATAGIHRVTLRVTDDQGGSGTVTQPVSVTPACTTTSRCAPRVHVSVSPKRDRTLPLRFTTSGRLLPPSGVTRAAGCRGRVLVQIKRGKVTVSSRRYRVTSACRFRGRVTLRNRKRLGRAGTLRFITKFQGNKVLTPKSGKVRRVRIR